MLLEYELPIVLPPIGPLFTISQSPMTFLTYESEEQREQYEEDMARYFGVPLPRCLRRKSHEKTALCTPTSIQLLNANILPPSTSPVKKTGGHCKTMIPLLQLQLDSPTHTDISNETEQSSEEEKLRVSRERNRLHAQRTRIRKRELLESLKERIDALQDEFELLKQAYDFHATAVCLLRLGNVYDVPCVARLEQVGIDAIEDRDKDGHLCESTRTACVMRESDDDEDEIHEHENGCELKDGDDVCTCASDAQLNVNGKRPYLSIGAADTVITCSKEERERARRERNRLHARRARLRKKLVLEKSQQAVHDLRERNNRLRSRLSALVSSIYGSDACLDDPDATS